MEEFVKIAQEFDEQLEAQHHEMYYDEDDDDDDDDDDVKVIVDPRKEKLTAFLQHIALVSPSSEKDNDDDNKQQSNHPFLNVRGKIRLSTIHKAKGLEWENVFLIGCSEGLLPHYRSINTRDPKDIEEERRLAFVAVTRAQKRLYLSYAKWRNDHQNENIKRPTAQTMSIFFVNLPPESTEYRRPDNDNNDNSNGHQRNKKKNKMRKNIFRKRRKKFKAPRSNKNYSNNQICNPNDTNSMVEFSGFQKANKFASWNDYDDDDTGRQIRAERAKQVEQMGTGFRKASELKDEGGDCCIKTNVKKKRKGFKAPRIIKPKKNNNNINSIKHHLQNTVDKENCNNSNTDLSKNFNHLKVDSNDKDEIEIIDSKDIINVKTEIKQKKKAITNKNRKRQFNELENDNNHNKKQEKKPPKKKRKKNKSKKLGKLLPGQTSITSYFGKK